MPKRRPPSNKKKLNTNNNQTDDMTDTTDTLPILTSSTSSATHADPSENSNSSDRSPSPPTKKSKRGGTTKGSQHKKSSEKAEAEAGEDNDEDETNESSSSSSKINPSPAASKADQVVPVTREDATFIVSSGNLIASDVRYPLKEAVFGYSFLPPPDIIRNAARGQWVLRRYLLSHSDPRTGQLLLVHNKIAIKDDDDGSAEESSLVLDWTVPNSGGENKQDKTVSKTMKERKYTLPEKAVEHISSRALVQGESNQISQLPVEWAKRSSDISVDHCYAGLFDLPEEALTLNEKVKRGAVPDGSENAPPADPEVEFNKRILELHKRIEYGCFDNRATSLPDPSSFCARDLHAPINVVVPGVWSDSGWGDGQYQWYSKSILLPDVSKPEQVREVVVAVKIVFIPEAAPETRIRYEEQMDKPVVPEAKPKAAYKGPPTTVAVSPPVAANASSSSTSSSSTSFLSTNLIQLKLKSFPMGNDLGTVEVSLDESIELTRKRIYERRFENKQRFPHLTQEVLGMLIFSNEDGSSETVSSSNDGSAGDLKTLRQIGLQEGAQCSIMWHFNHEDPEIEAEQQAEIRTAMYGTGR